MRHIIVFDEEATGWAVVDTQSANMVISYHHTRGAAKAAANTEEKNWPSRFPTSINRAA